ncbi:hypothetical protein [Motilibacter deserti]|uniref:Uncharacterized protein n=1 Tax=Motilibacter deserti TaxID=2714956 RepID=A0ABX0GZC5_9ACTN|nr:hypothetical protein [Motilibacter deserti]NHC16333.1 hypothetical protein [Motilibacter deserti]
MRRDDDLARLRAARPAGGAGWASSPDGLRTLARVQALAEAEAGSPAGRATGAPPRRPRPSRSRWLPLAGVVAVCAAVAGAVTIREATPDDPQLIGCYSETRAEAAVISQPNAEFASLDPVQACARSWPTMFAELPQPERFALCVTMGGGQVVVPSRAGLSDDVSCVQAGARPAHRP